jgi:hypothetical protein
LYLGTVLAAVTPAFASADDFTPMIAVKNIGVGTISFLQLVRPS